MSTRLAYQQAFGRLLQLLRQSLALAVLATTPPANISQIMLARAYFDHTVTRLALVYGRGTYENLSTSAIFATAIHTEALLHYEYRRESALAAELPEDYGDFAETHLARAKAWVNGARRAQNLTVSPHPPSIDPYRGVYIYPFTATIQQMLFRERDYFMLWRDGVVAIIPESQIPAYQEADATAAILFYSADDLLNSDSVQDPEAASAMFQDKWEHAQATARAIGDDFHTYIAELLLHQSIVLFHLLERTQVDHPTAYLYCLPIVEAHTQTFRSHLQNHPVWQSEPLEPSAAFAGLLQMEHQLIAHATQGVSDGQEGDPAGLLSKFEAVLDTGSYTEQLSEGIDDSASSVGA